MNRIARRTAIVWVLVVALVAGTVFFTGELMSKGGQWVMFPGSPHVYTGGNIGCGLVTDREGTMLLDMTGDRTYSESLSIRQSTLHWLGDRYGYISAPALSYHAGALAGYDILNGVYAYGEGAGHAELTLSAQVQQAALEALGGRKGTVAVYNYKTGQILCAVTTPTFDPDHVPDIESDSSGAYDGVYLNRFTQTTYIPGSIFKVVTTAAALEAVPDIQSKTFYCDGSYSVGSDTVTCETAHGESDLKRAMERSCNCAYAQIMALLGGEALEQYVEQFRVTQSVSFDGITTAEGNFDISSGQMLDIAWSGIGQGNDLINPCAYLTFMGAVAADGVCAQPHLVEKISVGMSTTYRASTEKGTRIMSGATAAILRDYMRNNVENNYGADNFPGMTVCAKSGTGEVGGELAPNATFCGFVTDRDYPLAFIVVVENGGYGSSVCVPIISQVLAQCKEVLDRE